MSTHFLRGPRRTLAAAGLIVASVAGVLVATSNSAQAAPARDLPLTICYAFAGDNAQRRVLYGADLTNGTVGYWVQAEDWSRSKRAYQFRSRSWVTAPDQGAVLRRDAGARCSYFTNGAFTIGVLG